MNITLKDVPSHLHERLRETAESSGRSLNKHILHMLESSVFAVQRDRADLFGRIRARRATMETWISDDSLQAAIQGDRE